MTRRQSVACARVANATSASSCAMNERRRERLRRLTGPCTTRTSQSMRRGGGSSGRTRRSALAVHGR
eukprot:8525812-Alexandrium_andersonii.AAC.1